MILQNTAYSRPTLSLPTKTPRNSSSRKYSKNHLVEALKRLCRNLKHVHFPKTIRTSKKSLYQSKENEDSGFHVGLSHCTTSFATSAEVQPNFTCKQDAKQAVREHRSFLLHRETGSAERRCGTLREPHTSEGWDAGPWLRPRQRLPSYNSTRSPGYRDGTSGTNEQGGELKGRGPEARAEDGDLRECD